MLINISLDHFNPIWSSVHEPPEWIINKNSPCNFFFCTGFPSWARIHYIESTMNAHQNSKWKKKSSCRSPFKFTGLRKNEKLYFNFFNTFLSNKTIVREIIENELIMNQFAIRYSSEVSASSIYYRLSMQHHIGRSHSVLLLLYQLSGCIKMRVLQQYKFYKRIKFWLPARAKHIKSQVQQCRS